MCGMRLLVLCVVSVIALRGSPDDDGIPPPVLRMSQLKAIQGSLQPPKVVKAKTSQHQLLLEETQDVVDSSGDVLVNTSPRPPRGVMGSTDHLKDDQFFLNIPFSEVEFNTFVDVTWVRPAAQMSKLDYIGLYTQGDADDAIPCNWEFAPGEEATGTVRLQMTNDGDMEIRYYDVAGDRPRVKVPIKVYPACANNCTNHGICEKGACVCFSPYKGSECCEVGGKIAIAVNATTATVGSVLHITLTPPAGDLDKRNWIGLFRVGNGTTSNAMQVYSFASDVPDVRHIDLTLAQIDANTTDSVADNSTEYLNVTATPPLIWRYVNNTLDIPMPYIPGVYVLKIIKNVDGHPVLSSSEPIYVNAECPNGCSGHGSCVNGTCHCDAGYENRVDCSIGNGTVRLAVSPNSCLVGTVITVTWERNADGGFSSLDYLALFDDADQTFDAPFAYQFAQAQQQRTQPQLLTPDAGTGVSSTPQLVDRGVVEFNAPTSKSKFVVRYFKRDHTQYAVSEPIEVYFDCLVPDCSGHGKCTKGSCVCDAEWKGSDCSVGVGPIMVNCSAEPRVINSVFNVTWSRPVKIGSIYDFIALYAHDSPNDQPFMYRYAGNKDGESQTSGQVTLQLPSRPGFYDVRYIDAFSRQTIAVTDTLEAHLPCPKACSGHGTCNKDVCACDKDWTARDDCSAKVGVVQMSVTPLTLETPSTDKIVVTYTRPEGSGYPQDFIGLFPKTQTDQRHPIDFIIPPGDAGSVQFSVPHYPGLYQARYISGTASELKAHTLDVDVTKACLNKCSQHGACNRGTCDCAAGWGSTDCSVGQGPTAVSVGPRLGHPGDKILVTYTRPVNNGSASDILGIYYKGATDMSTPLGFVMATDKDEDTVEGKMPGVEAELEIHYVRGTDQKSMGVSGSFQVTFPCKDDCNGHGDCKLGFCTCKDGFDGFACGNSVPTAFRLLVVGDKTVAPLATVTIYWEAVPKKSTVSDIVGLFASTDSTSATPLVYEYVTMRVNGTASLIAPYLPGTYVARYIGNYQGFAEVLASTDPISVVVPPKSCPDGCSDHGTCDATTGDCSCVAGWSGNNCNVKVPTDWVVAADSGQYQAGGWIQASWTRPPVNTGNNLDTIGVYSAGGNSPLQYQYVGFGNEGTVTLQAPTPTSGQQQTYRLQFMNGATGQMMASSALFTVTKTVSATAAQAKTANGRAHQARMK